MSAVAAVADPPTVTDWITAICALVTAPAVFTAVVGLFWDYRKHRQQQSLDFLRLVCDQLAAVNPQQFLLAIGFDGGRTKVLDSDQVANLCRGLPFSVNSADQRVIVADLLGEDAFATGDPDRIRRSVVVSVRKEFRSYLNTLEQAALAWNRRILDRPLLEDQIRDICDRDGNLRFQDLFDGLGAAEAFPNLAAFVSHLQEPHHRQFPR